MYTPSRVPTTSDEIPSYLSGEVLAISQAMLNDAAFDASKNYGNGTIAKKLQEFISITDRPYNASPSLADNSPSITLAIAALKAKGGGVLLIPNATFPCATPLNLDDSFGITIRGQGGRNVGGHVNASNLKYTGSGSSDFISMKSSFGCGVDNLQVSFTSATFTGYLVSFAHSALARDSSYSQVTDCYLGDFAGVLLNGNGVNLDKSIGPIIEGTSFSGMDVQIAGQDAAGGSYCNQVSIRNNIFFGANSVPIMYGGDAWVIKENIFENRAYPPGNVGAFLNTAATLCNAWEFSGNWCGDGQGGASSWVTIFGSGIVANNNEMIGGAASGIAAFSINACTGFTARGNKFDTMLSAFSFDTATTTGFFEEGNSYNAVTNIFANAGNQSSFTLASTGHTYLPNGLLMHWGITSVTTGTPQAVTFTPNFSATPYAPTTGIYSPVSAASTVYITSAPTASGMTLNVNGGVGASPVCWSIIGPGR